ncbi:hypothetical protein PHMEG_00025171 [Phytophthora megakarya]|uniref:Uncharacterized protein n=1 Tax=Phytophthora megakarya TaxID=4795 RepID=A0A225VBR5_9STRA|nr:hypothetical protein PHMEG_00025171 [Phytophthora megakarya]
MESNEQLRSHPSPYPDAPSGLVQSPTPLSTTGHSNQDRNALFCKELLRSRLQRIGLIEDKLTKMSNARDELVGILLSEKDATFSLAAALEAAHDGGYVMSYEVALERCCNILLERE